MIKVNNTIGKRNCFNLHQLTVFLSTFRIETFKIIDNLLERNLKKIRIEYT